MRSVGFYIFPMMRGVGWGFIVGSWRKADSMFGMSLKFIVELQAEFFLDVISS